MAFLLNLDNSSDAIWLRTVARRGATMTVPLLTLLVLIVAFSAEVGWLCRC